jgi:hypothetical protein
VAAGNNSAAFNGGGVVEEVGDQGGEVEDDELAKEVAAKMRSHRLLRARRLRRNM